MECGKLRSHQVSINVVILTIVIHISWTMYLQIARIKTAILAMAAEIYRSMGAPARRSTL